MSVTKPAGFVATGVASGIKPSGEADLALVATADGRPVPAAAVFTPNKAAAAPVRLSRSHLASTQGHAAAVLLNSGNANAVTGKPGEEAALTSAEALALELGTEAKNVLVCSTGLIGIPFDPTPILRSVPSLVASASPDPEGGSRAARAIMTTDTRPKQAVLEAEGFTVGAMAKGAAMLSPSMATMLAVLTTDACASPSSLSSALQKAVAGTFNEVIVDGCCSTNDTVAVLANGSGPEVGGEQLTEAFRVVCEDLAWQMVCDAEGATKVATVLVRGAADRADAIRAARQVATSQLFQCSLHGADPYWGRVVSEVGAAGVAFELSSVDVSYGGVVVCRGGVAAPHDTLAVSSHMAGDRVVVEVDLGLGEGSARALTTDLSPAYVELNATTS